MSRPTPPRPAMPAEHTTVAAARLHLEALLRGLDRLTAAGIDTQLAVTLTRELDEELADVHAELTARHTAALTA